MRKALLLPAVLLVIAAIPPPRHGRRANRTAVVDHVERVMEVAGRSAVGLETDFDGTEDSPEGLEDVSKPPLVTEELLRRRHPEDEVRAFWERTSCASGSGRTRHGRRSRRAGHRCFSRSCRSSPI